METNGHEVPEQAGTSYDRQLGAEGSGGAGRGKRWTSLLGGAVGGLIATGPARPKAELLPAALHTASEKRSSTFLST